MQIAFKDRIVDSANHPVIRRLAGFGVTVMPVEKSEGNAFALFNEIWCADFEFRADPGERPWPVCMVAEEIKSGRIIRLWRDELLGLRQAPFNVGPDALFVAYFASAEFGCFLELGWSLPQNVLDLYAEHRVQTNGEKTKCGDGLLGALALRGIGHIDAGEKDEMRRLILDQRHWSEEQQRKILRYCQTDVTGTVSLFGKMAASIDWPRALLRGRYVKGVASMEQNGIPIDTALHRRLVTNWDELKTRLIAAVDADFGVYEGTTFKYGRFADFLVRRGIAWPLYPTRTLKLDEDTFRDQARRWPELQPLYELRTTLSGMRLTGLTVGADGRNRCLLSPFKAVTGRNQPSNSRFIFGPARWMRGLIRPPEGYGLAYVDFASQEIGIAAGLSRDERMVEGYSDGRPVPRFRKGGAFSATRCHQAIAQSHPGSLQSDCSRHQLRNGTRQHGDASGDHARRGEGTASVAQGDLSSVLAMERKHSLVSDADWRNENGVWLAPKGEPRTQRPLVDELPGAGKRRRSPSNCGDRRHRGRDRSLCTACMTPS